MPARAHVLADIKHRRLIALAFADHNRPAHGDRVHGGAHGFSGNMVSPLAIAGAHGVRGSDSGIFHHARKLQRQLEFHLVGQVSRFSHAFPPRGLSFECLRVNSRSKRADAGHILADDQRMNIVRAFVRFY